MKKLLGAALLAATALVTAGCGAMNPAATASAEASAPLFVNLVTDDAHRADMALTFSMNQFKLGHPLTVFLNDRAVAIASTANSNQFAKHQKMLTELAGKGATVLVCPMCMKHFGVKPTDLLPGLKVGSPEVTGAALFRTGSHTMTW
ncbi:DsrE family protein [Ottowia sp.]|uniref:DsrE family protein n=1 Tax=Ottowia sp. TaxID=1898956 RepID=UPI00262B6926|nr:DsrE family protein [Ottowia sp.]